MTFNEEARKLAEDLVIFGDDYDDNIYTVAYVIDRVREVESNLINGSHQWIYNYLEEEVDEYDNNPSTQDHADEAKRLMEELNKLYEKE